MDSLYGKIYQGGLIFYFNISNGTGLVSRTTDLPNSEWGCYGTNLPGADGTGIGSGSQNSIDIDNGCTTDGIAADRCVNLDENGYSDWFLPSLNESAEMYLKIGLGAPAPNTNIGNFALTYYLTSSEGNSSYAITINFENGVVEYLHHKFIGHNVRPVRAF